MNSTKLKNHAAIILNKLIETYPNAEIELAYDKNDPWQLLVVVALSAQTTDKKVNEVSPQLFAAFKDVQAFACAEPKDIEPYIKSIGLYRNKAKNLVKAANQVLEKFGGVIPKNREELETIAGVGKKTAAVIIANAFNQPAIAVDTHVARVSFRLGLTKQKNPDKIEKELSEIFPYEKLLQAHHTIIFHGRRICFARMPHCTVCPMSEICPKVGVEKFK